MKKNLEFTFLNNEQLLGETQLKALKNYGNKASITDYAIALGGYVSSSQFLPGDDSQEGKSGDDSQKGKSGDDSLKNRTGSYWGSSVAGGDGVRIISTNGEKGIVLPDSRDSTIRPACNYPDMSIFSDIKEKNGIKTASAGIKTASFGEYPQTVAEETISEILEREYSDSESKTVKKTGNTYTSNSGKADSSFTPDTHIEYEYEERKYVRVVYAEDTEQVLSDGRIIEKDSTVWFKIEPVEWILDEETKTMIALKGLVSGIKFKNVKSYDGDFSDTDIKEYLDGYFRYDLLQNSPINIKKMKGKSKKKNPYNFDFCKVSEEDIIRGSIESGVAVFLHGLSSEGKSARVKQLDPDLEIIYLRNASPDSLNGKSVYNQATHEMIDVPPTWYKKIKEKCIKEPDKIHIVFFDEITNALPAIQGMAFNIVLDREVNGMWKLPDNARVVAAGNDYKDSLAANQLAEPLFNRFVHTYIETSVEGWLKWAINADGKYERLDFPVVVQEHVIHPAIYAYIAYKREQSLRTPYTGERPNADPRKWELASSLLYYTGQPEMLRGLVGEEITGDFVHFCSQQVITLDDVLNDNYNIYDLDMNTDEKWATVVGLSYADEKNVEKVRDFISKLEGGDLTSVFNSLWTHGSGKNSSKKSGKKSGKKK